MLWTTRKTNANISAPSVESIREKVKARLRFFEDELRKQDYYLTVGAEQEFHVLDANRNPWAGHRDEFGRGVYVGILHEGLKADIPLIESIYPEETKGKFEAVLGSTHIAREALPYPSVEIAGQVGKLREALPAHQEPFGTHISFSASHHFAGEKATAGLHINLGVQDANGGNLFYDKGCTESIDGFSAAGNACARKLLALQKEGLILYAPQEDSYNRFGASTNTPSAFCIGSDKARSSITLRNNIRQEPPSPQHFHIEDRLAGADADPYLVLLAGVGAIYHTLTQQNDFTKGDGSEYEAANIPQDIRTAREAFRRSKVWKQIAGDDLYKELVAYLCRPREQTSTAVSP